MEEGIGKVHRCKGFKLVEVEVNEFSCNGCFFKASWGCNKGAVLSMEEFLEIPYCDANLRDDGKNIIFKIEGQVNREDLQ